MYIHIWDITKCWILAPLSTLQRLWWITLLKSLFDGEWNPFLPWAWLDRKLHSLLPISLRWLYQVSFSVPFLLFSQEKWLSSWVISPWTLWSSCPQKPARFNSIGGLCIILTVQRRQATCVPRWISVTGQSPWTSIILLEMGYSVLHFIVSSACLYMFLVRRKESSYILKSGYHWVPLCFFFFFAICGKYGIVCIVCHSWIQKVSVCLSQPCWLWDTV